MGTIKQGVLGSFSGKVGTVIGASWKGINYMRSIPQHVKNPRTEGQVSQRSKFALVLNFLKPVTGFLRTGWKLYAHRQSPFNAAMSYTLANAITAKVGAKNCLLISIHTNAANGKARGWEIHTFLGNSKSDEYATIFWNEAKALLPKNELMRGDHTDGDPDWDSNFAILRDTVCPAVLTENLFMDNPEDCRYLLSETGKQVIVAIHVQSILKIAGK
jgi:hypothetical protein